SSTTSTCLSARPVCGWSTTASAASPFREKPGPPGLTFDLCVPLLDSAEPLDEASAGTPDQATTGLAMGRYRVKVLPAPGSLSSVISPASRRVSSRQMERPKP